MEIERIRKEQWRAVREIYREAFPRKERKPFWAVRRAVRRGRSQLWTAQEDGTVFGFILLTTDRDMALVEYLAVSDRIRSRGTGSRLLQAVCAKEQGKRIVLLIERPDDGADNREQRIARRRFYLKNGFVSAHVGIRSAGGSMEVLCRGGTVTGDECLSLHAYALGRLFFALSGTKLLTLA